LFTLRQLFSFPWPGVEKLPGKINFVATRAYCFQMFPQISTDGAHVQTLHVLILWTLQFFGTGVAVFPRFFFHPRLFGN
jgi:hypothetical protein